MKPPRVGTLKPLIKKFVAEVIQFLLVRHREDMRWLLDCVACAALLHLAVT